MNPASLSADLVRGLYDALPPGERDRFVSGLPDVAAPKSPPKLLKISDVAARFDCTPRTVQRWIREGELPVIRRGRLVRIPEDALYERTGALKPGKAA